MRKLAGRTLQVSDGDFTIKRELDSSGFEAVTTGEKVSDFAVLIKRDIKEVDGVYFDCFMLAKAEFELIGKEMGWL